MSALTRKQKNILKRHSGDRADVIRTGKFYGGMEVADAWCEVFGFKRCEDCNGSGERLSYDDEARCDRVGPCEPCDGEGFLPKRKVA